MLLLTACLPQANAAPVVKIGLIAPFEGQGRALGYALLPEVKDVIAGANESGALGAYRVALIALNDNLDPAEAAARAQALALDPTVVAVVGPWSNDAASTAAPVLEDAALPVILGAATPSDASNRRAWSVCPPYGEMASELLSGAKALGQPVILAGSENALAGALSAADPDVTRLAGAAPPMRSTVIHAGDAETVARDLAAWRAAGWQGALFGGPDLAQPWFVSHAGESAAEGVMALVCGAGAPLPPGAVNLELAVQAQAARRATQATLDAIAVAAQAPGGPTRDGVAAALDLNPPARETIWLIVSSGEWAIWQDQTSFSR